MSVVCTHVGAPAIAEGLGRLPVTLIADFLLVMQLSNMMTQHQIFYVVIVPFITFFFLFAFWMYPNVETLHPTSVPQTP